jgi:hypothetical protein
MRRAWLVLGFVGWGALGGCAETPTLTFYPDDDSPQADGGLDATTAIDAAEIDTGSQQVLDNDGMDSGPDAATKAIACGTTTVANCGLCAGKPMRCTGACRWR